MSAPVTEAHIQLVQKIWAGLHSREMTFTPCAQLIADSEAKAVLNAAKSNWSESIGFIITERDQLRAEVDRSKATPQTLENAVHWEDCERMRARAERAEAEVERLKAQVALDGKAKATMLKVFHNEQARAERAEASLHALRLVCGTTDADKFSTWVDRANARAERAEAELANIRALADRRNKGDHSQDTTHQLVVALDQALDIAQAELADEAIALRDMMSERDAAEAALTKERARLDWLAESWDNPLAINLHPSYGWSAASKNIRAAIDAAMKEGNA